MDSPLEKVIGYEYSPQPVSWNKRDLIIYALGIGAKHDDYRFVYELDPDFAAFPTYPVASSFKGTGQDVNIFANSTGIESPPGVPNFSPDTVVHGSQTIELLKPIPTVSGEGWTLTKKIVGMAENKTGVLTESESVLKDPNGEVYVRLHSGMFNVGVYASGPSPPPPSKYFSKRIHSPPAAKNIPKNRKPDWIVPDSTTKHQALVYRLSGDYNPLHVDPLVGAKTFGGVVLHGLGTFGIAARAVLESATAGTNDPAALKYFGVRFTSPVNPGDRLETHIWEVGQGPNGITEFAFETRNAETGKIVIGNGIAYVKKTEKSRL